MSHLLAVHSCQDDPSFDRMSSMLCSVYVCEPAYILNVQCAVKMSHLLTVHSCQDDPSFDRMSSMLCCVYVCEPAVLQRCPIFWQYIPVKMTHLLTGQG